MKADYRQKVKTLEELAVAIGPRPRAKSVIMCHGMFDIVHPGHMRHMMYAKGKADILVASLTADAHATKAAFRPYVRQVLSPSNLAVDSIDEKVVARNGLWGRAHVDRWLGSEAEYAIITPDVPLKEYDHPRSVSLMRMKELMDAHFRVIGHVDDYPWSPYVVYRRTAIR